MYSPSTAIVKSALLYTVAFVFLDKIYRKKKGFFHAMSKVVFTYFIFKKR